MNITSLRKRSLSSDNNQRLQSLRTRSEHSNRLPSENDYTNLLKRLDLVISNANCGQKLLILTQEIPLNIYLDKNSIQYIHINPKGNLTPLQIKLTRNYGKLKIYISRTITEPCEEIHDDKITDYLIEVNENANLFKMSRIALGIKALTESNFIISLKYGILTSRIKNSQIDRHYRYYSGEKILVEEDSLDLKIKQNKIQSKLQFKRRYPSHTSLYNTKSHYDLSKTKERRELNYSRSKNNFENLISYRKKLIEKNPKTFNTKKKFQHFE